ncbi:MAG: hypothetical protein MJY57_02440 [Bacteroidales bacterium]|nr:hypothetical protein [Bacteroidales bacterium]
MKSVVLIFTVLLSFIFSEGRIDNACVVQCSYKEAADTKADFNDVALLPAGTMTISGNGNSFAPSFRSSNSGRRVQPSTKSSFRLIKAGKIFDRNNFHTFLTVILQFQSGIRSNSRYIHSICQLLI